MTESENPYRSFLNSPASKQWSRIGIQKRAGVCIPLFSIYSEQSTGIGDFHDLKLLIDWARQCGMSMIQLLPLNDVGFDFRPYDAQSSFALDPMYASLPDLIQNETGAFQKHLGELRTQFPAGTGRVHYGIKKAKLNFLWEMFQKTAGKKCAGLDEFIHENSFWLCDYAAFKVLKELHGWTSWESWPDDLKYHDPKSLRNIEQSHPLQICFQQWLQWQLFEQLKAAKEYARSKGVLLIGDLPFLVSKDSADVWSHQDYFKLNLASGAPPDAYCANGQRWGMPPYDWARIAEHDYDYLAQKLKYAEHFYDLYRIDHFVGLFRIWTIPVAETLENGGRNGVFDPSSETVWEAHGRGILDVMLHSTGMLPCAEDLGVVPQCSFRALEDYCLPGMDVQRWMRDWDTTREFKPPECYRNNSAVLISTHDMMPLAGWWELEANTSEREKFWNYLGLSDKANSKCSSEFIRRALERAQESASIFSIQLFQDWLSLDDSWMHRAPLLRINLPGTMSDRNWTWVMPFSLEALKDWPMNKIIREINEHSGRI